MSGRCFAFVYARSDSSRAPGKVLAWIGGCRLIDIVFERLGRIHLDGCVLLTTDRSVDDALATHCKNSGRHVVRGHHSDLISRTLYAIDEVQAEWFLRINADSPLVEPSLIEFALASKAGSTDFVSNLFTRTFPYGISVELIKASTYRKLACSAHPEDLEHVTQHLYRCADGMACISISTGQTDSLAPRMTIDTPDDLAFFREKAERYDLRVASYWAVAGLAIPKYIVN